MSIEAIAWAFAQPIKQSTTKFVLVAMANCVNAKRDDYLVWPSMAHLAEATGQNRKTVLDNIKRLTGFGYLTDTKERKGVTKRIIVYDMKVGERGPVPEEKCIEQMHESNANSTGNGTDYGTDNSTENGTAYALSSPENGPVQKLGNGPVFTHKWSRKRDTEREGKVNPKNNTKNQGALARAAVDLAEVDAAQNYGSALCSPEEISEEMGKAGIVASSVDDRIVAMSEQGVSLETVHAVCVHARRRKPGEDIGVAYLIATLAGWKRDAAAVNVNGARAPPVYPSANDKAKALADRLTGRTKREQLVDVNDVPFRKRD